MVTSEPGTYTLNVTGTNGCTVKETVTVTQDLSVPTVTIAAPGTLNCTVTSVTINATVSPQGTYSYRWTDEEKSVISTSEYMVTSEPGTYTLNVTGTNGCTFTETVTVNQDLSVPTVEIATPAFLNCTVTSVTINATVTPEGTYTYSWMDAENNVISTSEDPIMSEPGTYTLNVTGSSGCTVTETVTVFYRECETAVGSISGTKFEDENGNHEWDTNETGLGEWIINLNNLNGEVVKTATTSADQATTCRS